ncbi:hypothetical protein COCNU_08G000410 [Cocos nucifera]|uniref:Uncharacterized protein n=1 Tax=Cocos nucifera TaxID=13894 RepID=A0A8K0IH36_COCNU|nr:hypothetical protein COCNU_08G000410 [Cocos nucifera]
MKEMMAEKLKWLMVPLYSKLLRKDLLKKLYYSSPTSIGLAFLRKKLVDADLLRKKNKEKKRNRIILSPSSELAVAKAMTTKIKTTKPKVSGLMTIEPKAAKSKVTEK